MYTLVSRPTARAPLLDHFPMELSNLCANQSQDPGAFPGQAVLFAGIGDGIGLVIAPEPPVTLHPPQQGVEGTGADVVSMSSELTGYPLAIDGPLRGMMENVNFPETQENFSSQDVRE